MGGGGKVTVRIPGLESIAVASQQLFATSVRELLPEERKLVLDIFGDSVNRDVVRIARSKLSSKAHVTLGNTINVARNHTLSAELFVHEMTHVWQYQTRGSAYISDSSVRQINHDWFNGRDPYKVDLVPGKSFYDYAAEEEAVIVQYYFVDRNGWRTDPDVLRMIGEVKSARPLSSQEINEERWWGAGGPPKDDPSDSRNESSRTVPLFRIEW